MVNTVAKLVGSKLNIELDLDTFYKIEPHEIELSDKYYKILDEYVELSGRYLKDPANFKPEDKKKTRYSEKYYYRRRERIFENYDTC